MVDFSRERPPSLRPPAGGDRTSVRITSDVGPRASVNELVHRLGNLGVVVELGERWGTELARAAAGWDLRREIQQSDGRDRILNEAARLGYSREDVYDELDWHPRRLGNTGSLSRALSDQRALGLMGSPTRVQHIEYSNPLELLLTGSGMLLAGVIYVTRLVRDWSNKRQADRAVVREAEAEARMTESRADLYRWLVDETRAGRNPVPVGDLVQLVTPAEVKALNRLADCSVSLQLPPGSDPG